MFGSGLIGKGAKLLTNENIEKGLVHLGGLGPRGSKYTSSMERAVARGEKAGGLAGRNAAIVAGRREQLLNMGKRRAMWAGGGMGLAVTSSAVSGMRARSSGGYTGANTY